MEKIEFKDYPNLETPIDANNLNQMQTNIEENIDNIENALLEISEVIEKGVNANGTYIKYKDGTLICRFCLDTKTINTTYHFVSGTWAYPAKFIEIPNVQATPNNWNTNLIVAKVNANLETCSFMTQQMSIATMTPVDEGAWVNLFAFGKWK